MRSIKTILVPAQSQSFLVPSAVKWFCVFNAYSLFMRSPQHVMAASQVEQLTYTLALQAINAPPSEDPAIRLTAEAALGARFHAYLNLFFHNSMLFRTFMRSHAMIISGSVALHFFTGDSTWRPHDLDIYVSQRYFQVAITHLTHEQKLVVVQQFGSSSPYRLLPENNAIRHVVKFRSPSGYSVDLICSDAAACYPIPFYWGTHLMNIVTADYACAAYPSSIENHRIFCNPIDFRAPTSEHALREQEKATTKYIARGYSITSVSPDDREPLGHTRWREFGDKGCRVLRFACEEGVQRPSLQSTLGNRVLWTHGYSGDIQVACQPDEYSVSGGGLSVSFANH